MARPVVATDLGPSREILGTEAGRLVPPDATALARALQDLLESPAERARLGRNGRQRAEACFGLDRQVRQMAAIYADALRPTAELALAGRDVVFLYAPPWDAPTRFSKHHLASFLAERGNRVLYVEAPLTPLAPPPAPPLRSRAARRPSATPVGCRSTLDPALLPAVAVSRLLSPDEPTRGEQGGPALARAPATARCCKAEASAADRDCWTAARGGCPAMAAAQLPDLSLRRRLRQRARLSELASRRSRPSCVARPTWSSPPPRRLRDDRRQFNANTYWVPNGADVAHFAQPASPARRHRAPAATGDRLRRRPVAVGRHRASRNAWREPDRTGRLP